MTIETHRPASSEDVGNTQKKIIVEIGPGINPVYWISEDISKDNQVYVGIDISKKALKENITGSEIQGDLESLPLKPESVDEIWLMNVFGGIIIYDASIHGEEYTWPSRDKSGQLIIPSQYLQYFIELARVLKPGGVVHIGEYYDPDETEWIREVNYENLGLEKEVFTGKKRHKIPSSLLSMFLDHRPDCFFMILKKVADVNYERLIENTEN